MITSREMSFHKSSGIDKLPSKETFYSLSLCRRHNPGPARPRIAEYGNTLSAISKFVELIDAN